MINRRIIVTVRTEEERIRRHLYGEGGAKFSSRSLIPSLNPWSNTISTVTKDNLIINEYA